jgi:hypothetical protein
MASERRRKRKKFNILATGLERNEHTDITIEERRTGFLTSCLETFINPNIGGKIKEMRR